MMAKDGWARNQNREDRNEERALGPEGRQLPAGCASTRMAALHQFSGSVSRLRRETQPENK